MVAFFHSILYTPIYNLLIFFVDIFPGGDVGLAVIGVTLVVKFIVMPFSISALRTQRAMKRVEPELKEIRIRLKDDKDAQAKETFAVYKKYKINPFASIVTMLIQLPVLICLYWVFRTEHLPTIDTSLLYSFVHVPPFISLLFLGIIPIASHSLILALVAAITQFIQARYAIPAPDKPKKGETLSMQEELGRTMALQARFVLPIIIGVVAYASGGIALYFITSNIAGLFQEFYVRRTGLRVQHIPE